LRDLQAYNDVEILVLDYNSEDGLGEWIKKEHLSQIESGQLKYFQTFEPKFWSPSHSKNMAFKLSAGDLISNIWADYFVGAGYPDYVYNIFDRHARTVMTPISRNMSNSKNLTSPDVLGKVCVRRKDFMDVRGFDERMDRHGFEDYDFVNRLEMNGVKRVLIKDPTFLKFVPHSNDFRYTNEKDNLFGIYIQHLSTFESGVLFLYKNYQFNFGIICNNTRKNAHQFTNAYYTRRPLFEYSVRDKGWKTGTWSKYGERCIELSDSLEDKAIKTFRVLHHGNTLQGEKNGGHYFKLKGEENINSLLVFNHFYTTRCILEENLSSQKICVNPNSFGHGSVFMNFQYETPIHVR
jgi:hypothetical protein